MKMTALIVDDEPLARNKIRRLLRDHADIAVLGECASGDEAVEALRRSPPDLLFLDIEMPRLDGFAVLESVGPDRMPVVVFVTAYDEYAIRAFEARAFDYLLKPFHQKRFTEVLDRAREQIRLRRSADSYQRVQGLLEKLESRSGYPSRIQVKEGGKIVFVKVSAIDWIEAADNYVCLHCGVETHVMRETLTALEARLDPERFRRIHRSAIVNLDRVRELEPSFSGDFRVTLVDGHRLTWSRSYRQRMP